MVPLSLFGGMRAVPLSLFGGVRGRVLRTRCHHLRSPAHDFFGGFEAGVASDRDAALAGVGFRSLGVGHCARVGFELVVFPVFDRFADGCDDFSVHFGFLAHD